MKTETEWRQFFARYFPPWTLRTLSAGVSGECLRCRKMRHSLYQAHGLQYCIGCVEGVEWPEQMRLSL